MYKVFTKIYEISRSGRELKYSTFRLLLDVGQLLRPYWLRFALASLCRAVADVAWLYPAFALAAVVTFFSSYKHGAFIQPLVWTVGLWVVAVIVHSVTVDLAKYLGFEVSSRMALDMQLKATKHLFLLDAQWHEREGAGNKIKRIQRGVEALNNLPQIWIMNVITIFVNFAGVLFIINLFDRFIALAITVFLLTYFPLAWLLTKQAARKVKAVNVAEEEVVGISTEAIHGIRSVKLLGIGGALGRIIDKKIDVLFQAVHNRLYWQTVRSFILNTWGHVFRLATIGMIVWGILQGRYEIGFLVLFYEYFNKAWDAIQELSEVNSRVLDAKYAVARLMDILREPIRIDNEEGKQPFPEDWQQMEVRNLSFTYGSKKVLQDISFTIRRGEKVGIVGLSGSGKSTLLKLMLKKKENYEGDILFDGVPLKKIKKSSYFAHAAVVPQETELFNLSLADNILLTNSHRAGDADLLQKAIKVAHVVDFLPKLPQSLDTSLGEKGSILSGGEKQRVGIARAIIKEPQLLFMDEATANLDIVSENKIRDSLSHIIAPMTAIVIAHRLSTIREMDKIIVLDEGAIVESGSFQELYDRQGRFYEAWEKQRA